MIPTNIAVVQTSSEVGIRTLSADSIDRADKWPDQDRVGKSSWPGAQFDACKHRSAADFCIRWCTRYRVSVYLLDSGYPLVYRPIHCPPKTRCKSFRSIRQVRARPKSLRQNLPCIHSTACNRYTSEFITFKGESRIIYKSYYIDLLK